MHDRVELGEIGRHAHVLMRIGHVDEADLSVLARNGHCSDAILESESAMLDRLIGELPVGIDTLLGDHLLNQLADHVAAGDTGALVEHPVARGAHHALALVQPVTEQRVVLSDLAAGDRVAVAEALDLAGRHRAGTDRAGVDDVGDATDPADQLTLPEDRDDGVDVTRADIADQGIVVAEEVLVSDARIGLPVIFDHVFDRRTHRTDMDDDAGGGEDRVARRVVESEAELAFLLDDR